jgi:hypothetical protein
MGECVFCGAVPVSPEVLGRAICGGVLREVCGLCSRIVKTACASDLSRARVCVHLTAMEIERVCVVERRIRVPFGVQYVRSVVDFVDPDTGVPVQGLRVLVAAMDARFARGAYRAVCGCATCAKLWAR